MRARAAYIQSLGTTSILVASALLMLAIVSAIVAFRGWPAPSTSSGVPSVPLQQPAPAQVAKVAPAAPAAHVRIAAAASNAATVGRRVARASVTPGLVKQVRGEGPATVAPAPGMAPAPSSSPHSGAAPQVPSGPGTPPAPPANQGAPPVDQVTGTVEGLLPPVPTVPNAAGPGDGGAPLPLPRIMRAAYRVIDR